jgi:hypothetical protein
MIALHFSDRDDAFVCGNVYRTSGSSMQSNSKSLAIRSHMSKSSP